MVLTVLYFAWLRERTGSASETIEPPDGTTTLGALRDWLGTRHPGAFANPRLVRAAVNQEFAGPDTLLADGDEVAFFPPVTGG